MKRLAIIILSIILVLIFLVSCNVLSNDKIENTVNEYFHALETHDLDKLKKYRPNFNEELKSTVVDTVLDCNLISIDFDYLKKVDEQIIEVPVKYEITYSDEYIPIGSRDVGKNEIYEIFTLKDNGDYYIITKMINPYLK